MRPIRFPFVQVLCAVAALALAGTHAEGQLILPVEQDRTIHAFGNAAQCGGEFYNEFDEAVGFNPFHSEVEGEHVCEGGASHALAAQDSIINDFSILASGRTEAGAHGPDLGVVHAIAVSSCDITFQVPAEREFYISATLSAGGMEPPGMFAGASVRLLDVNANVIFEGAVEPGPNGELESSNVHTFGTLAPGQYRLQVQANSVVDAEVPPDGAGSAAFDAMLVLGTEAVLNDIDVTFGQLLDGTVNELGDSDDEYVHTQSQFGFSAAEPNIMDIVIGGAMFGELPSLLHVTAESRLNNPGGVARVRLFNWAQQSFVEFADYPIGLDEAAFTVAEIDATDLVRKNDARFEVSIRHVVLATFAASGFESFLDHLHVLAN